MNPETIIPAIIVIALLSAIILAMEAPKDNTLTIKVDVSEEETPHVVEEVIKLKRKYKKRVSKKNTITSASPAEKRPIGRPKKAKP